MTIQNLKLYICLFVIVCFLFSSSFLEIKFAKAADYLTNQDYAGANWTLANGDRIAGLHTNIGNFIISGNVSVMPFNGSSYGSVEINAQNITITGTLSAIGAGFGGGGGGGGNAPEGGYPILANGAGGAGDAGGLSGHAGQGALGSGELLGGAGGRGGCGAICYGGAGGAGGDLVFAPNVANGNIGTSGSIGGYQILQGNENITADLFTENIYKGSGGGGGGGGSGGNPDTITCSAGAGGGGAGNRGGGYIKLIADSSLVISGNIFTNGLAGSTGNGAAGVDGAYWNNWGGGGNGGSAAGSGISAGGSGGIDPVVGDGGPGGNGGAGAGGGILLKGNNVTISGNISALGGVGNPTNGGTLKISTCGTPPNLLNPNIQAGRAIDITNLANCGIDIGLNYRYQGVTYQISVDPLGTLSSNLRIFKGGNIYSIQLVNTTDVNASPFRIRVNGATWVLKKR